MRTALVMMTILGCDDSNTDCQYVATINQRWPTIELCNAVSEKELASFTNVSYPVVIAVCQDPAVTEAKKAEDPAQQPDTQVSAAQIPTPAEERAEEQSLARRALDRARTILPTTEGMRHLVERPVNLMEDGYSWVVRKLR